MNRGAGLRPDRGGHASAVVCGSVSALVACIGSERGARPVFVRDSLFSCMSFAAGGACLLGVQALSLAGAPPSSRHPSYRQRRGGCPLRCVWGFRRDPSYCVSEESRSWFGPFGRQNLFLQSSDGEDPASEVISPVMARSRRTGICDSVEAMAIAMVMPADGPSLGIAPAGTWIWRSCVLKTSGLIPKSVLARPDVAQGGLCRPFMTSPSGR